MKLLLLFMILFSCGKIEYPKSQPSIYGSYLDGNGECLLNIGHRVGGGFRELRDNEIESAYAVENLQNHECFSHWEFDVNSTKDTIIVTHDDSYLGTRLNSKNADRFPFMTYEEFISEFTKLNLVKNVRVDLKKVKESHFELLIREVQYLSNFTTVKIVTHINKKDRYSELIPVLKNLGFSVGFYR